MAVNPLPILFPLFLGLAAVVIFLFRWRKSAGLAVLGLCASFVIYCVLDNGRDKRIEEPMLFRLVDSGHVIELTRNDGQKFSVDSPALYTRLKGHTGLTVRVVIWANYSYFGKMRSYFVRNVDGFDPDPEANEWQQ